MRQSASYLTQSRFYSPAFNAAIFDGPLRIYFAQYQEALALKIYFAAQSRLQERYGKLRELFRRNGLQIFVLLYPSAESFALSFDQNGSANDIAVGRLGIDYVIGACGPLDDDLVSERIVQRIDELSADLTSLEALTRLPEEELAI